MSFPAHSMALTLDCCIGFLVDIFNFKLNCHKFRGTIIKMHTIEEGKSYFSHSLNLCIGGLKTIENLFVFYLSNWKLKSTCTIVGSFTFLSPQQKHLGDHGEGNTVTLLRL